MDRDCFNLIVRKIMFDDIQTAQKTKRSIVKHYLDLKFWANMLGKRGRRIARKGAEGEGAPTARPARRRRGPVAAGERTRRRGVPAQG
ncbi:hypothetical protein ZWY2020_056414 [Hordeum vulgare]|nr:hypothetical protein ZWY2020_056414 [Hordeum vulgare]